MFVNNIHCECNLKKNDGEMGINLQKSNSDNKETPTVPCKPFLPLNHNRLL